VFDGVPEQVLEQPAEPLVVGRNRRVGRHRERRVPGLRRLPGAVGDRGEIDGRRLLHRGALAGERQELLDEAVHPLERVAHPLEVLGVAALAAEFQPAARDRQRRPEVVAHGARELR